MTIILGGPIGAGKTTYAELAAKELGSIVLYEPVESNPILDRFYHDKKRWAFSLQIYFLNTRYRAIKEALRIDNCVQDRSIYEDPIFALQAYEDGNMDEVEYRTYIDLLGNMMEEVEKIEKGKPELMVYLQGSFETTLSRIVKRGRSYELQEGLITYYKNLYDKYQDWIKTFDKCPVLIIDIDRYDVTKEEDATVVAQLIKGRLKELEIR